MKSAERDRILARKQARQDALLKRVKAKNPQFRAKAAPCPRKADEVTPPPATTPDASDPSLAQVVAQYVDEYTAAQAEIAIQRDRLIAMRGGEEHLTEDDHDALENIRDIVTARYERLLEV